MVRVGFVAAHADDQLYESVSGLKIDDVLQRVHQAEKRHEEREHALEIASQGAPILLLLVPAPESSGFSAASEHRAESQ